MPAKSSMIVNSHFWGKSSNISFDVDSPRFNAALCYWGIFPHVWLKIISVELQEVTVGCLFLDTLSRIIPSFSTRKKSSGQPFFCLLPRSLFPFPRLHCPLLNTRIPHLPFFSVSRLHGSRTSLQSLLLLQEHLLHTCDQIHQPFLCPPGLSIGYLLLRL